jgi:DNA-binding NarL/FixJ family response regulator
LKTDVVGERGQSRLRVLLVDDSAKVRQTLSGLFSSLPGFEVIGEAQDGLEAIEILKQLAPNVVILDLRMPRLNGFEVLRAIRQCQPSCAVIVFSAMADDVCRQKCLQMGAKLFFDKVTQFDEFLPAIKAMTPV